MKKKLDEKREMSVFEHLEELRQRALASLIAFSIASTGCLMYSKNISYLLEQPAYGIKFLQLAPGEYFFTSIKIALYSGFLLSSPVVIYQIILFILPGLNRKEKSLLVPMLLFSVFLFFAGIVFAYKVLAPTALNFLINYGADIVEPIWSFEQYFNFILLLLFSTGTIFQIPIAQIALGIFNIVSSRQMIFYWRYVIFVSTIVAAILTPSTDPMTQILMSLAILLLYTSGIAILKTLNK